MLLSVMPDRPDTTHVPTPAMPVSLSVASVVVLSVAPVPLCRPVVYSQAVETSGLSVRANQYEPAKLLSSTSSPCRLPPVKLAPFSLLQTIERQRFWFNQRSL